MHEFEITYRGVKPPESIAMIDLMDGASAEAFKAGVDGALEAAFGQEAPPDPATHYRYFHDQGEVGNRLWRRAHRGSVGDTGVRFNEATGRTWGSDAVAIRELLDPEYYSYIEVPESEAPAEYVRIP